MKNQKTKKGTKQMNTNKKIAGSSGSRKRPPLERMKRIFERLKLGNFPNCTTMAAELGVSAKSVQTDLDFVRDRWGMPIEYDPRQFGFFFSKPVGHFPGVPMTEQDVFALFVASKAMEQYQGTALEPVLAGAFRKLIGQLDDSVGLSPGGVNDALSFRACAPGDAELETFELLMGAVGDRQAVKFVYRKHGRKEILLRHVHPYHIAYVDNRWCLFAFDVERQGMRTFVLSRVGRVKLTGGRFTVAKKFDLNEHLSGSLGLYRGEEDCEVVVDFDSWAADDVLGRRWHTSQALMELEDGGLRVKMRLNSLEEVERWVLGFGKHATVVEPVELRQRLLQATEELSQRYGGAWVLHGG